MGMLFTLPARGERRVGQPRAQALGGYEVLAKLFNRFLTLNFIINNMGIWRPLRAANEGACECAQGAISTLLSDHCYFSP